MHQKFKTKYGYFSPDGKEFVVTKPDTPKPWVNIICPGDYGITFSNVGSGYSWKTHASFNSVTRWNQDLIKDEWGKYIYVKDESDGKFWSLAWQPVKAKPKNYLCRHGIGYTTVESENSGIKSEFTVFVPPKEPLEIWKIKLENRTSRKRKLSLFTFMELCLGATPDTHREFHKLFIDTEFDSSANALLATKRLWSIGLKKDGSWSSWHYCAFHSSSLKPKSYETDKEAFLGTFGSLTSPKAVKEGKLSNKTGKWQDAISSIHNSVELKSGESKELYFVLGAADSKKQALGYSKKYHSKANVDKAFNDTRKFWNKTLSGLEVNTPDEALNTLTNSWLKYQAISSRIWGRTGYWQQGGAFGYRDQLQDSHVFLPLNASMTKKQLLIHAAHQFEDGTTYHWWHPFTETGLRKKYNDDLLWMPFVAINYLKETRDFSILNEKTHFLKENGDPTGYKGTLYEHCRRAIDSFWGRLSKKGIPLMGAGDWNDGLSEIGAKLNSESVWLAHFLIGILDEWVKLENLRPNGDRKVALWYAKEAQKMRENVNKHFWDGNWYIRATKDNGKPIGTKKNVDGKIFLNAQTWAIINKVVPESRLPKVLKSLKKYLYREYGPILFYPAFRKVDREIGYLTRYAPGSRENGGLYTHAGVWAIQAECSLGRADQAWDLYKSFNPIYRGMDPDFYQVEPYVTPGNVDGPDSPNFGRAGWTWYTGSASWYFRIATEWILGVRPTYEGLIVKPCIPSKWKGFSMKRSFRGAVYNIKVERSASGKGILVDGKKIDSDVIPVFKDKKEHSVLVKI